MNDGAERETIACPSCHGAGASKRGRLCKKCSGSGRTFVAKMETPFYVGPLGGGAWPSTCASCGALVESHPEAVALHNAWHEAERRRHAGFLGRVRMWVKRAKGG